MLNRIRGLAPRTSLLHVPVNDLTSAWHNTTFCCLFPTTLSHHCNSNSPRSLQEAYWTLNKVYIKSRNVIPYTVTKHWRTRKDVHYPTLHDVIPQVAVREIKSMTYKNKSTVTQQHKIEASETITKKSSWSVTNKLEANFHFGISAGIPEVAEVSSGFGFTVGTESTHGLEEEKSHTETLSFPVKVPAGKTVNIDITIGKVTIDLPYTARVEMTCYNNSVLSFNTNGIYKGLTYTDAKVVTKEIP
ncbi:aerolysin-like protein [Hypomesus transpacificus]|uniref:aerolysin-like protein n=1 Tax=Hypomesus transpacificus TaxID=137520 RepID=UPI001F072AFD|nr:aerolysin-like protein [Hypomesus transpacificus]